MNRLITSTAIPARELKIEALASMSASFERLCLAAGLEALGEMMEQCPRDAGSAFVLASSMTARAQTDIAVSPLIHPLIFRCRSFATVGTNFD